MNGDETVEETDDLIGAWLNMIDRVGDAWVNTPDLRALPDGLRVQQDSERWCALFFKPGADPHGANVMPAIAIHRATTDSADIIRYDYARANMRLRLYETVDFALLRIEQAEIGLLDLGQDKRPEAVASTSAMLLNKPASTGPVSAASPKWPFVFTGPIQEGSRFSTAASRDPHLMPSWTSRVDGGVHAGHLFFLCFKKRQSGDGRLILLNSHHWFDGQAWAPYAGRRAR